MSVPRAIRAAEDKANQLACAMALGFRVPRTMWTNDTRAVRELADAGQVVVKSVATAAWEDDSVASFVYAQLVDVQDLPSTDVLAAMPAAFQQPVMPKRDLRVTVIGRRAFGALVEDGEGLDWRLDPDRPWAGFTLPDGLAQQCVALVAELGLRFGAIDIVLDSEGTPWFLEVNPNGEWGWLNQRAGLPLAAAIAEELGVE